MVLGVVLFQVTVVMTAADDRIGDGGIIVRVIWLLLLDCFCCCCLHKVMDCDATTIFIPFVPLLERVTECLRFPKPVYGVSPGGRNSVYVRVRLETGPGCIYYLGGGEETTMEASREKAAQKAVQGLMKRYGVCVDDFTFEKVKMYELCGSLFARKCGVLDHDEKTTFKCFREEIIYGEALNGVVHVSMDYVSFLTDVVKKTAALIVSFETVSVECKGFMCWIMISFCCNGGDIECIFSDTCYEVGVAELQAAKKAICFLAHRFNLVIIDANYGNEMAAHVGDVMWSERCLYARASLMVEENIRSDVSAESSCECFTPIAD
ncbi:uncharacterized protein LOC110740281 [Chenopodium quinoa]|uniref:uncharacterized protein LOC110740281 n=1 Tax=Chenopodium quinoa TaxID=63459 RepID=UPI000B77DF6C|nr:uncharacterized protein LOC110740281 [Chenopodium quinoa]